MSNASNPWWKAVLAVIAAVATIIAETFGDDEKSQS